MICLVGSGLLIFLAQKLISAIADKKSRIRAVFVRSGTSYWRANGDWFDESFESMENLQSDDWLICDKLSWRGWNVADPKVAWFADEDNAKLLNKIHELEHFSFNKVW